MSFFWQNLSGFLKVATRSWTFIFVKRIVKLPMSSCFLVGSRKGPPLKRTSKSFSGSNFSLKKYPNWILVLTNLNWRISKNIVCMVLQIYVILFSFWTGIWFWRVPVINLRSFILFFVCIRVFTIRHVCLNVLLRHRFAAHGFLVFWKIVALLVIGYVWKKMIMILCCPFVCTPFFR